MAIKNKQLQGMLLGSIALAVVVTGFLVIHHKVKLDKITQPKS